MAMLGSVNAHVMQMAGLWDSTHVRWRSSWNQIRWDTPSCVLWFNIDFTTHITANDSSQPLAIVLSTTLIFHLWPGFHFSDQQVRCYRNTRRIVWHNRFVLSSCSGWTWSFYTFHYKSRQLTSRLHLQSHRTRPTTRNRNMPSLTGVDISKGAVSC